MRRKSLLFLLSVFLIYCFTACLNKDKNVIEIKLLTEETHQTIHNFGASDCWSGQFIGNWPDDQRNRIADLLFSTQSDHEGNPVGIGLSCWRINIGAGTARQGDDSNIGDEWRRAPGVLNNDGTFDLQTISSQRWLMRAASKRGCNQYIAFSNSPPVQLTKNAKAYSAGGNSGNLDRVNYSKFALFLADVITNIKNTDEIDINYISPFNEPEWDWKADTNGKAGQEGSPWLNREIKAICKEIDSVFSLRNINTLIEIPESGQMNYLYDQGDKPGRSNHIEDFFSPVSPNYLGNLSHMAKKIAGHSYFTTWDDSTLVETRKKVAEKITEVNQDLEFWMSEYCILENNDVIKGHGKDLSMAPALYMAKVIHADIAIANASAWHWWLAVSPYDYKDGLVYIEKSKTGGKIETSKMLWGLGNFSRFITPGSKRIGIVRSDDVTGQQMNGLLISGYRTLDGQYVTVVVNQSGKDQQLKVVPDKMSFSEVSGFITSEEYDLSKTAISNPDEIIKIPAESIVSLIFKY